MGNQHSLLRQAGPLNAVVYVDFENILKLLNAYGKDPLEMDFFGVIHGELKAAGLNIIDFIVYADFEKKSLNGKHQTLIRALGFQTRHASNDGKSSGDLELTVNAIKDLYKNPNINIFIFISAGRDIIPLLKAIKYENKLSYVISTQDGFNQTVAKYADFHEYIEDIFQLTPPPDETTAGQWPDDGVELETAGPEEIRRAREVALYFQQSHIWKRAFILGTPVSLKGYLEVIAKVVHRSPEDILNDFKLAHRLKYITLYRDPERGLCVKAEERLPGDHQKSVWLNSRSI